MIAGANRSGQGGQPFRTGGGQPFRTGGPTVPNRGANRSEQGAHVPHEVAPDRLEDVLGAQISLGQGLRLTLGDQFLISGFLRFSCPMECAGIIPWSLRSSALDVDHGDPRNLFEHYDLRGRICRLAGGVTPTTTMTSHARTQPDTPSRCSPPTAAPSNGSSWISGPTCCTPGWPSCGSGSTGARSGLRSNSARARCHACAVPSAVQRRTGDHGPRAPSAEEPDQRDAEYAFLETDYDADTWKDEFGGPGKELPTKDATDWTGAGTSYRANWFPSDNRVRVMDWYCAEYDEETLYELHGGQTATGTEELDIAVMETVDPAIVAELEGVSEKDHEEWMKELRKQQTFRKRAVQRRVITVRRIDAKYIHETTAWPTPWQPFVPWVHEETDYMGERDMRGTVRDAKDAQRVYNVNVSSLSEAVNDAPKNRVVGYKGQFGKPDSMTRKGWEEAPNKRFAYLEVEPITIDGKPAPFPQPFNIEPAVMGLAHAISQADNDLKATGRFHDASLAEAGPEQSGKAIIARQRQDELSNGGFINGHLVGLASVCRQLIELYRVLYTTAQIVRITGEDDQKRKVMIFNGEENDPRQQDGFQPDTGVKEEDYFDIGSGEYDVEVKPGPQAGSRREEDLKMMGEFVAKLPADYMMNFMDLLFELVDAPAGRKLSERAGKLLPEGLRDEGEEGQQQDPAQLQAKLQQAAEEHQKLTEAFEEAKKALETKQVEADNKEKLQAAELASKEGIEQAKLVVEWTKVMAQSDNDEAKNKAKAEVDRIFADIDAKRLALDAKKADDSFVLGEHKIQSGSAASRPWAQHVEGNQGGR